LPGFLGKLMVLESSAGLPAQVWIWSVVLVVGFLTIVGLARAGVIVFWHVQPSAAAGSGSSGRLLAPVWAFMALTVALAVLASPVKRYTDAAAAQLSAPGDYVRAVLGDDMAGRSTTRPYDGQRAAPAPAKAPTTQETQP
jgi:multicomponent K+:H+ antiporter subunit D